MRRCLAVQMLGRVAVGGCKNARRDAFLNDKRGAAYSYVKMLKIHAKPCKNKINHINSQQGHFRCAALPATGAAGGCGRHARTGPLSLVGLKREHV